MLEPQVLPRPAYIARNLVVAGPHNKVAECSMLYTSLFVRNGEVPIPSLRRASPRSTLYPVFQVNMIEELVMMRVSRVVCLNMCMVWVEGCAGWKWKTRICHERDRRVRVQSGVERGFWDMRW